MSHTLVVVGGCLLGAIGLVALLCLVAVLCAPSLDGMDVERL